MTPADAAATRAGTVTPADRAAASAGARALGHLRLMRPWAWIWFDLLPAATLLVLLGAPSRVPAVAVLVFAVAVVLADSGGSTLNDLCDVETDRASPEPGRRGRPVAAGLVTPRAAAVQAAVLLVSAPLLLAAVSVPAALAMSVAIAGGIAYSLPPFRLCGRPWASVAVWPVVGGAAYASAALLAGIVATPAALLYLAGVGVFYVGGETFAKDLRDLHADRASGRRTAAGTLGPSRAARVSAAGTALGTALLLALVWGPAPLHPAARVGCTAVLLAGLAASWSLAGALARGYDQARAAALHRVAIRTYFGLNLCLLVGSAAWTKAG